MFKNYFKTAVRNLLRNKIYSFINIAGLSIGLACAMLIILYLKDEVSYDRFHANGAYTYRVVVGQKGPEAVKGPKMGITGFLQGPKFTAKIPGIKAFVRLRGGYQDMKTGTGIRGQQLLYADSNFFSVFSFPLISGNPATALSSPQAIVLSEDIAEREFGKTAALGKIVMLKNQDQFKPYTVTGVAKRCPQNSSISFDVLLPFKEPAGAAQQTDNWFSFFLTTYLVLDPRADVKATEAAMQQVYLADAHDMIQAMEKKYKQTDNTGYYLQPLTAVHLGKDVSQEGLAHASDPVFSYILGGIAVFILFIACINFVNLTLSRSLKRAKEIGIRKVVGGGRKQLIAQFLGESFIVCLAGFLVALVIVQLVLPLFNSISNKALSFSYLMDAKLITGYAVLCILTGFLAGIYPAVVVSAYNPVQTLYGRFTLTGKNYLQKGLVIVQFTLAAFLMIATMTIFSQFNFMTTAKLGYDDSNLVLVNKTGLTRDEARLFRLELLKYPGITGVAAKDEGYSFNAGKINGGEQVGFANVTIDETYLPLLKIPIVTGRNFSADFPSDSAHAVIVNETFVKNAGWKEPVGQQVDLGDRAKYTVVGVVKDYHFQALSKAIVPELFSMRATNEYGMAYIKIKPGSATGSLNHIEKIYQELFPANAYTYLFKDQENLKNYEAEARWKQIMLLGAALTIFISCIGLFALSVSSAEKRTKEIGIRKVLGASVTGVVTSLSKDFLKLVIIALLLAMPLAWLIAGKWLENYPYRISLSWQMFTLTGLLIIGISLATISFQAIKAAIANPVKSLRTE